MSQKKQQNKHSQGFKGLGKGNNNNGQGQGGGGGGAAIKTESPRANIHTGNTIRTQEQKRKTVFKAVLDSPFNVSWPDVSIKDQNEILDALCENLSVIGEYRISAKKRKKGKMKADNSFGKVVKVENDDDKMDIDILNFTKPPSICSNICFGMNEVTKHLEQMTNRFNHHHLISTNPNDQLISQTQKHYSIEMIFVCKADLLPQLYSHFPIMCSIAGDVLLIPLPSGASKRISDVVNFKRVSCIGVKTNATEFKSIYEMVKEKVKHVNTPWLNPLKPPESLLNKRKINEDDEIAYLKQGKVKEEDLPSSNNFKQKQVKMTCDDEPRIKVEVASSLYTTSSPPTFFFGQQPKVKIEPTSIQSKPTSTNYVPTQIKQLITTAPANKDQAKEKRREKKLKYKQRKMKIP